VTEAKTESHIGEVQCQLEEQMNVLGKLRLRRQIESQRSRGEESKTPAGRRLISHSIRPFAAAISQFLGEAFSGRAGKKHTAAKLLDKIEPDVSALLASKALMNSVSLLRNLQTAALECGGMIEDEIRYRAFIEADKKTWTRAQRGYHTDHYTHRRRVLQAAAKREGVELPDNWTREQRFHVGMKLIDLFQASTGLIEVRRFRGGKGRIQYELRATPATLDWIKDRHEAAEALTPVHLPMVEPPLDWSSPSNGGYRYGLKGKLRLVKTRNRGYLDELHNVDMPLVYQAVNALQQTAWRINKRVLEVAKHAAERGHGRGGLPATEQLDLPEKPHNIGEDEEARKDWRRSAAQIHSTNRSRGSKAIQIQRTIWVADRFSSFNALYFPYVLDFRGRAYPAPMFLQPQGTDLAKGLLEFSEGKAVGENGWWWLAVHGANCLAEDPDSGLKIDKLSLQERVDWVFDNTDRLCRVAQDPYEHTLWDSADKPLQFLAFCYEWADFADYWNDDRPEEYISHIPVAMDGSCNGLQHFSAMLRDPIGGAAVNLTPQDRPADIYQEVADRALERATEDAAEGNLLASAWLQTGFIDRKLCKRPVMTMPYGSKQFGMREQILEVIREKIEGGWPGFEAVNQDGELYYGKGWHEAGYMAAVIWEAIGKVVVSAREAMDWLQQAAGLAAKDALPIYWTAPSGFPVMQAYPAMQLRMVKTMLAGNIIKPRLQDEQQDKLDKTRQRNGVSPNFVHSLDAAAMMLTIHAAQEYGVTAFAMVHDSYGTHAADAETLAACTRVAFVDMYEAFDPLKKLRDELLDQLPEESTGELPELPEAGSLDLRQVEESDYFFS